MPKKKWEKPKLIILVRQSMDEACLANCKTTDMATKSSTFDIGCSDLTDGCAACDVLAS